MCAAVVGDGVRVGTGLGTGVGAGVGPAGVGARAGRAKEAVVVTKRGGVHLGRAGAEMRVRGGCEGEGCDGEGVVESGGGGVLG
mgnify:CR=1 FL=1